MGERLVLGFRGRVVLTCWDGGFGGGFLIGVGAVCVSHWLFVCGRGKVGGCLAKGTLVCKMY